MRRGLIVALAQVLLVLSLAAKYEVDRRTLPRAWARTGPFDPNLPIRGRYVRLRVLLKGPGTSCATSDLPLVVEGDRLVRAGDGGQYGSLCEAVAFFLPEHVPDPSIRLPGEELWVELTVPRRGPDRKSVV